MSVRRALAYASGERYGLLFINFLTLAAASRLMTPGDFGLAALGTSALSIIVAIRDFGAASYLVQVPEAPLERVRTAFTVTASITLLLTVLVAGSAWLIADFYANTKLTPYILVMAASMLATPFSGTLCALLRRDMQFGRLALVSLGGQTVGAITTVTLAWLGLGYMSIAWAALASGLVAAILALAARPTPRVFVPLIGDWRHCLGFGGLSSATALVNQAYGVLATLVMGWAQPMASVGLFNRAQAICQISDRMVFGGVASVALAALSQHVRAGREIKTAYLTGLTYITGFYWPLLCLLALLAAPLVRVLLGPQWHDAVPLVRVLALSMLFLFPAALSYPTLVAAGGIADTLTSSLISLPPSAVVIGVAALHGPLAVAASQFVTIPLQVCVVLYFIKRRIHFTWREFFASIAISAVVTACAVLPSWLVLLLSGSGLSPTLPVAIAAGVIAAMGWVCGLAVSGHPLRHELEVATRHLSAMPAAFLRSRTQAT